MDDVQDADEEMEDNDEESEEEEGSLYAPTEATSELGEEEPNEYQDSVQLPIIKPCKFLARLPRELRDKVCALTATSCVRVHALTICSYI